MAEDIEIEGLENEDVGSDNSEDVSVYDSKSEFKKPLLAMEGVRACREARATEMKQGFWNTKLDKVGNPIKTWQPDQRRVYVSSVIALEKFLSSECINDKKYIQFKEDIVKKINIVFNKFAYSVYEYDSKTSGWKKTDTKIIPQIDEELLVISPQNPTTLVNMRGAWNYKVNAYFDELVPLYDEIFEELNKVIYRLNDFSQKFSN